MLKGRGLVHASSGPGRSRGGGGGSGILGGFLLGLKFLGGGFVGVGGHGDDEDDADVDEQMLRAVA